LKEYNKIKKEDMLLYVVTDRTWLGENSLIKQVEESVKAGATFIQLREKNLSYMEFVKTAKEIKTVTDRYKVPFVINDNVNVALEADADGVHIGQGDEDIKTVREKLGKYKIIGLSAHNAEEAKKAQEMGADYIGVGAVFNTATKSDVNQVSFETLKEICQSVHIPVVAIGGISKSNIHKLSGSGADGVAVVSAIFAQPDIGKATTELLKLSKLMVTNYKG
jgi:thiamine-phosphate pyrophosphorylase